MGIVLLIGSLGLDIFSSQINFSKTLEIQQEVQQTFIIMAPELRSMESSANGSFPLASATSTSLKFYSDIGLDGSIDRIRYFLSNDILKKGVIVPSGNPPMYDPANEVVSDVIHNLIASSSPIFTYYDQNFTGSAGLAMTFPISLSDVRIIKTEVTIDPGIQNSLSPLIFSTQIAPRNLK